VIIVLKVLNMDISSYKKPLLHFRRPLLTPWRRMDYFYDGWMHFFESQALFTTIIKLWRARIFLYNPETHIKLRWLEGE